MGGWTGEGKDTIEWDGTIRAKRFVGTGAAGVETDPVWTAWLAAATSHPVDDVVTLNGNVTILNGNILILTP